jgi:phosphomethylpyrimidine synthase
MSKIKIALKNRKRNEEMVIGGERLPVVFPYGLGPSHSTIEEELHKINIAKNFKADMVKDNTIGRKEWYELIKRVRDHTDLCVGASATITAANIAYSREEKYRINPVEEDFYEAFERLSEYCDAIEVFPTITLESLEMIKRSNRTMKGSISRAGDIITRYMSRERRENPFYQDFDWFLDKAKRKEITLILGNGFRAGCLEDSLDDMQMYEVQLMSYFSNKALERGVGVIAGVFGHVKYNPTLLRKIRENLDIPIGRGSGSTPY